MTVRTKTYSSQTLLALVFLFIPMIVTYLKYTKKESKEDLTYNKPNLVGLVISDRKPELSLKNWLDGSYQNETDDYDNDHWAFKELMVRLNNQFYYKAFNQIRVNQFVSGKENYVFAEVAIQSYFGNDFIGQEKINQFLHKCKVVQDTLSKKGISLILAYAPGKGIGAPTYIEDKYSQPIHQTNREVMTKQSKALGINHVDLIDYFYQIKDTCKSPLYARFAHHWTYYFDCLASQKIVKFIEKLRNVDLPDVTWAEVEISDTARSRDNDVLKSMNLYTKLEQGQPLVYPKIQIENDTIKNKTKVLTIGDSYWYGIVYLGVPQHCFSGGQFWYYNNRVVPNPNPDEKTEAWQLDLKQSIESNQVILIIGSDPAFPKLGWGFIDNAYELYTSPKTYYARNEKNKLIQTYAKQIRDVPNLLKKATQKSNDLQIPLDSAIKADAMKMAGILK